MPAHLRAIHLAASLRNVREEGHNGGFWVEWFLRLVGHKKGAAWCAAFVYWCLVKSAANVSRLPKPWRAAAVRFWVVWAFQADQRVDVPMRGRLGYWLNANGTGHIFFVLQVAGGTRGQHFTDWEKIRTIEGNTDGEEGSREGDGVYQRWRARAELERRHDYGFIDLEGV